LGPSHRAEVGVRVTVLGGPPTTLEDTGHGASVRFELACRLCAAKVVSEVVQSLHLMPPTSKRALRRRAEEAPLHVIIALMLTDY
jgi:hypothetical protein